MIRAHTTRRLAKTSLSYIHRGLRYICTNHHLVPRQPLSSSTFQCPQDGSCRERAGQGGWAVVWAQHRSWCDQVRPYPSPHGHAFTHYTQDPRACVPRGRLRRVRRCGRGCDLPVRRLFRFPFGDRLPPEICAIVLGGSRCPHPHRYPFRTRWCQSHLL